MLLGSILLVKYTGDLVRVLQLAGSQVEEQIPNGGSQQASGSCPFKDRGCYDCCPEGV